MLYLFARVLLYVPRQDELPPGCEEELTPEEERFNQRRRTESFVVEGG